MSCCNVERKWHVLLFYSCLQLASFSVPFLHFLHSSSLHGHPFWGRFLCLFQLSALWAVCSHYAGTTISDIYVFRAAIAFTFAFFVSIFSPLFQCFTYFNLFQLISYCCFPTSLFCLTFSFSSVTFDFKCNFSHTFFYPDTQYNPIPDQNATLAMLHKYHHSWAFLGVLMKISGQFLLLFLFFSLQKTNQWNSQFTCLATTPLCWY